MSHGKYKGVIEKITVTDATFKNSERQIIEPSWINFFYGNNGTGKSTIARTVKSLNGLIWKNGLPLNNYVVRVFCREFISEELKFDDESPLMPSVVTFGKEIIGVQDDLSKKQAERESLLSQLQKDIIIQTELKNKKDNLRTSFVDACWEKGKEYKKIFGGRGAFATKELFAETIKKSIQFPHDFADLEKRYKTARDQNTEKHNLIAPLDISELGGLEAFSLLSEPIISTADSQFNRFMQSLEATAWVKYGHEHYESNANDKCPYCQQPLNKDLEMQIAECFDGKYSEDCLKIASHQQRYTNFTSTLITTIRGIVAYLKSLPQGFGNIAEYEKNLTVLEKTAVENNRRIGDKIAKPSETVTLDSLRSTFDNLNVLIAETNALLRKNNDICADKSTAQAACLSAIIELAAFELKNVIKQYGSDDKNNDNNIAVQAKRVNGGQEALRELDNDIQKLTGKLGGSGATVQSINALLKNSGFRGFSLVEHETVPDRYKIIRDDGSVAKQLSEGERNFIAFLYFYYLVRGIWKREEFNKGKIVVIDDPVSSLDSGVLSLVGALVRELIEDCFLDGDKYNIKQIFILTHNPYFHHAASQQMLRPEGAYFKKTAFFEVKKGADNISTVHGPRIQKSSTNDPEVPYENIEPVQNLYFALWQEYKDARQPTTLLYMINRIADYYFFQLCSYDKDELKNRISFYVGSDESKLKIINEMLQYTYENTSSEDGIDSMIYFPASHSIDDYKDAFRTVFQATGQEQHYAKMSGEG